MSRFDYVKYDQISSDKSEQAKEACTALEAIIDGLENGREKSLALTNLEQTFMWIGKAVRNEQVAKRPE